MNVLVLPVWTETARTRWMDTSVIVFLVIRELYVKQVGYSYEYLFIAMQYILAYDKFPQEAHSV